MIYPLQKGCTELILETEHNAINLNDTYKEVTSKKVGWGMARAGHVIRRRQGPLAGTHTIRRFSKTYDTSINFHANLNPLVEPGGHWSNYYVGYCIIEIFYFGKVIEKSLDTLLTLHCFHIIGSERYI